MTGNFLSRWSRLKTEAKDSAPQPTAEPVADNPPQAEPPPLDLPPVETLTKDSDFSAFLQTGVPEAVKRAAMAKLWSSDPLFSQPEVFDLHMEDYSFPTIPEVVKTAWRVGQGIVEELSDKGDAASFTETSEKTHNNAEQDKDETDGS
ncbi:MAG: DUF3306 domain-containing protein [Magnetospirillum sp.]|nr:DUF3306 domain-containing protein [Magnetospirillum sp.]